MLDNTISIDYGVTTGIELRRINQDDFGSLYRGESGTMKFSLNIKHTFPAKRGEAGESHLVRLDVEHYDINGLYLRTTSSWNVIKTFDGSQVSAESSNTQVALAGILDATFVDSIVGGES